MTSKISYFSSICCIVANADMVMIVSVLRRWTCSGTRTASSAAAVTPGWGRWATLSTPRGTSCSARETTSACLAPLATAPPVIKWSPPSRWWWEPGPTSIIWSASPASSAATGERPVCWVAQADCLLSGSVWVTSSIYTRTRSSAAPTTRRGCCLPTSTTTQTVLLKLRIIPGFFPHLHRLLSPLPRPLLPQVQPAPAVSRDTDILPTPRPPPAPPFPSVGISTLYLPSPPSSPSVKGRPSPSDHWAERISQRIF